MPLKILSRRTLFLIAVFGLFSIIFILNGVLRNGEEKDLTTIASDPTASYSLPVRLVIPSIGVYAGFEYVGLTDDGAMDVPEGPANVAWYNLGPRPGEIGNSVVAGHSGWKDNKPAVFDNLHKLKKGDKIYIEDEKGMTVIFIVRESLKYDPEADATSVFISSDDKAHLNLVTCEGVWNEVTKSRSERLVVFTDKEIE